MRYSPAQWCVQLNGTRKLSCQSPPNLERLRTPARRRGTDKASKWLYSWSFKEARIQIQSTLARGIQSKYDISQSTGAKCVLVDKKKKQNQICSTEDTKSTVARKGHGIS